MALKKITSANSPLTLTANDFSQLVNIPYCLLVASGGGVIDVTLPSIESLNKFGQVFVICEDGITTVNLNVNPADAITESGAISASKTITGNKNFVQLNATTYVNGNIWLGSTNGGSGGGGGGVTAITYNALVALAGAGNLTVGAYYLITDFQMATYIQFSGGGLGAEDIHTGAIEPMIVQAASGSGISGTITSTVYPTDVINYSLLFADRDWDAVLGQSTGVITYREDTIYKNSRDYDFRNIIFRRWETVFGSGNYDSVTNTGFGFNDYPPFSLAFNNKISSCLLASPLLGVPYQLDNTVFQGGGEANIVFSFAYANTFQGFVAHSNIDVLANCLFVGNFNTNQVGILVNNIISGKCINNVCSQITDNTLNKLNANVCGQISDNTLNELNANNCDNIAQNNFSGNIEQNNCNSIYSNVSNVLGASISSNEVNDITDNTNFFVINNNVGGFISNNISSAPTAEISYNEVNSISDNVDFTSILQNVGNNISSNTRCQIRYNSVGFIETNVQTVVGQLMTIERNSGYKIASNSSTSATGVLMTFNNCNSIEGNAFNNMAFINGNNGNTFTNNTFNPLILGSFDSNGFVNFYGNTINGASIQKNLFMGDITGVTFTPTVSMASATASVTLIDSIFGNVEQILIAGVITYTPF